MRNKKSTRTAKILVRVSKQEKELANNLSYGNNESMSLFIRRLIKDESERTLTNIQEALIDKQIATLKEINKLFLKLKCKNNI